MDTKLAAQAITVSRKTINLYNKDKAKLEAQHSSNDSDDSQQSETMFGTGDSYSPDHDIDTIMKFVSALIQLPPLILGFSPPPTFMASDKLCWCPLCPAVSSWRDQQGFPFLDSDDLCATKPMTALGLMAHLRQACHSNIFHYAVLKFLETYYCKDFGNWRGSGLGHKFMYQLADNRYKEAERHERIYDEKSKRRVYEQSINQLLSQRSSDLADEQNAQTSRSNDQTDGQRQHGTTEISDAAMKDNSENEDGDKKPAARTTSQRSIDQIDGQRKLRHPDTTENSDTVMKDNSENEDGVKKPAARMTSHRSIDQNDGQRQSTTSTAGNVEVRRDSSISSKRSRNESDNKFINYKTGLRLPDSKIATLMRKKAKNQKYKRSRNKKKRMKLQPQATETSPQPESENSLIRE